MTAAPKLHDELVVTVPVKVLSEANLRNGHMARWRRGKAQQNTVALVLRPALSITPVRGPWVVTLTRLIGRGGRVLDDDNAISGFKAVRDAVAACLGVDDGDRAQVTWRYDQRKQPAGWGVEIAVRSA
jgi:hypothetical protein